jgi:hypothetical protein
LIVLPCSLARQFRAVLRRCSPSRSAPPAVLLQASAKGLSLQSVLPEVAVQLDHAGQYPHATLAFSGDVLGLVEGRSDDPVTLKEESPGKGRASWSEASALYSKEFALRAVDELQPFPELPAKFHALSSDFLTALADASETAAREHVRYALERVLVLKFHRKQARAVRAAVDSLRQLPPLVP